MTKLFIDSEQKAAQFVAHARAWIGTPYVADGSIQSAGASCSGAPWGILHSFGHPAPEPPRRAGLQKKDLLPLMKSWLSARPELFLPIPHDDLRIGDVLLFDCGIGHLGVMVDREEFVHSWQTKGVHATHIATERRRLVGAWRPIVP